MWLGLKSNQSQFHFQENKSVSLRDIAGLLKLLLINCKQGINIKDLNRMIITKVEEKTKLQQNTITITRRIYQCLKVMKCFGMVQKHSNLFKYTFGKVTIHSILEQNQESLKKQVKNTDEQINKHSEKNTDDEKNKCAKCLGPLQAQLQENKFSNIILKTFSK